MHGKNLNDPATLVESLRADLRAGCLAQRAGNISRQHYLRCPHFYGIRSKEVLEIFRLHEVSLADMQTIGRKNVD
jgi:hypothetical protein